MRSESKELEQLKEGLPGDLEDLKDFAEAKAAEGDAETIPWDEIKRKLNL